MISALIEKTLSCLDMMTVVKIGNFMCQKTSSGLLSTGVHFTKYC